MRLETVEAVGPFGVGAAEPVVHREQALKLKSCRAALPVASPAHQAGPFEHLEVLGDGGLRQRGCLCKFDDAGFAGREALEDRAAGWVGQGREGAAQGIFHSYYPKVI